MAFGGNPPRPGADGYSNFEHDQNFHGALKDWDGGTLFHKFEHERQMTVEGQGHFAYYSQVEHL